MHRSDGSECSAHVSLSHGDITTGPQHFIGASGPSMVSVTEAETLATVDRMCEILISCQSRSNFAIMNSVCRNKRILRISL